MASFPISSPIAINHSENRTSSLTSSPRSSVPRPELSRINTPNLISTITSLSEQQRSTEFRPSRRTNARSTWLRRRSSAARRIRSWNSSS
ncbi:hypothetical protein Csa_023702 [Cucumis sativus]|nr:hypothetical protein Csa_023702 [Cucumis sativus]